ncbi:superoxide dismutase family protein [Gordonia sp. TBRC 11910]|uniref:Superoxide dismutase [Cu-Zn] n=1 Tax=Gordonia asplenii TaxID=2725283 RepID=A0A848L129_9ACTN|nr:superoxide dismutase family protein [Gordonia asplenii]NMO04167.1 superoxide dismutase family protein [Gordonia asplenii]
MTRTWVRAAAAVGATGVAALGVAACSSGQVPSDVAGTTPSVVTGIQAPPGDVKATDGASEKVAAVAKLTDTKNNVVGTATFTPTGSGVRVSVEVTQGIPAGFHGLHIHSNGVCDPSGSEPFISAGGHLQVAGHTGHPASGDLISLNVLKNGTGTTVTTTDAVQLSDIVGKSIVIHALPDNFGNIPSRYSPPADEKTMTTGDAGGRIACGTIDPKE